jgi:glycopeptide antibiotics resistance protein
LTLSKDKIKYFAGLIYSVLIIYLLFFAYFRSDTSTAINLTPFKTISNSIRVLFDERASLSYISFVVGGLIGNVLLLFPIPILFKLEWGRQKKWLFIIGVPVCIELIQYLFMVGAADVDDLILNSTGGLLGFWIITRKS